MCRVVVFGEFQTFTFHCEKLVLIFTIRKAIGTIMSMALSVVYAILLLREWKFYSDVQRMGLNLSGASYKLMFSPSGTVVSIILAIYGLSTILLYLM